MDSGDNVLDPEEVGDDTAQAYVTLMILTVGAIPCCPTVKIIPKFLESKTLPNPWLHW
jgi:hypothetical protein